jgi:microcystin-dependent protein
MSIIRRKNKQINKSNYYNLRANDLIQARGPVERLIVYERVDPPVGSIVAYTVENSPTGWLVCDGTSVNKETYSKLYEAIGNKFGGLATDLSFNLPNYKGAFLRGIGANNGYTGPSTISSYQGHATQTHNHTATSTVTDGLHRHTQNSHIHTATTVINEEPHTHTQYTINDDFNNNGGAPPITETIPSFPPSDSALTRTWTNISSVKTGITATTTVEPTAPIILDASCNITVSTTVLDSTTNVANETRPYNYGVYWIIKY